MVTRTGSPGLFLRGARRVLRYAGRTVLVLAGLLGILLLTFMLPPVRGALLGVGLRAADRALPGTLAAGGTAWPALGHLVLEDLVWLSDRADTLAAFPRLEIVMSLPALRQHDLVVDSLAVVVASADVPGIESIFAAAASAAVAPDEPDTATAAAVPWLRTGAATGVPSVVLRGLDLRVGRVVVAPALVLRDARLQGQVDAGHGRTGAQVELAVRLTADRAGTTPVFLELDRLELAGRYGPTAGRVDLESLLAVVVGGPVPRREELREAGPVTLRLAGEGQIEIVPPAWLFRVAVEGRLDGPLSGLWGEAWPADLAAADFERCEAVFTVDAAGSPTGTIDGGLFMDLAGSDGVERGRLRLQAQIDPAHPRGLRARLDTLDLAVTGCALAGHGALTDSTVELVLAAAATAPVPLLILAGPQLAQADLDLALDLQVSGPRRTPSGHLDLRGHYRDERWQAAGIELTADGGLAGLTAQLRSGRLVQDGAALMDSVACDLDYAPDRALPLTLAAFAERGADRITSLVSAGADTVATVRLDSLQVVVAGQSIRLEAPATIRADTAAGEYFLEPLMLTGTAGSIHVAGSVRGGRLDLAAGMDLLFTEELLVDLAPSEIWSRDGGVDLVLQGDMELDGTSGDPVFKGGITAELRPHRDRPRLGAQLSLHLAEGQDTGLAADLRITANDTVLLHGTAFAPGRMDLEGGGWQPDSARDLELVVPEQRLNLDHLRSFLPDEVATVGSILLDADVRWPLGRSDPGAGLTGTGSLAARLEADALQIELPNRSRMELDMACRLAGTPLDPHLEGEVTVVSGFIRIPEIPRSLHPTEGTSHLWEVARTDSAAFTLTMAPELALQWRSDQDVVTAAAPFPEMDLKIRLPGNLRLHGYGLDAELTGEVDVRRGVDDKGRPGPALRGEVGMVRGTLRFMNRQFEIDRGNVLFTGQVPANPQLDLHMRTETGGYRIIVGVSGRVDDPVVDLTSEPDLNKADIMAVLLFGRPLNDLDADQRGRTSQENDPGQQLQENLAGLAMVFGTKGLQDSVTSTFGVDLVEFGSDSSGGSTFAAGKYISPNMLLKYHQSLETSGTYFMTLEYVLNQAFRVVSTYGQGEESSGLELKWERRY